MSDETYFVKFKTSLGKEFEVTNEIITIPRDLKRLGISQVINHLLGTTGMEKHLFYFSNSLTIRKSNSIRCRH